MPVIRYNLRKNFSVRLKEKFKMLIFDLDSKKSIDRPHFVQIKNRRISRVNFTYLLNPNLPE